MKTCNNSRCNQTPTRVVCIPSVAGLRKGMIAGFCQEHTDECLSLVDGLDVTEGTASDIVAAVLGQGQA